MVRTEEIFNFGPEWRAFTPSESAKRERATPTPYSAFDGGLYTRFKEGKDANGVTLTPEQLQKWRRLRRFDFRTKSDDNKIRNLNQATIEIYEKSNNPRVSDKLIWSNQTTLSESFKDED